MPSLWQESFGLVAVEAQRHSLDGSSNVNHECQAQLRGIPVVSTAACGLREANFLEARSSWN